MSDEEQEFYEEMRQHPPAEAMFDAAFWNCMITARDWLLGDFGEDIANYHIADTGLSGDVIEWAERVLEYETGA